MSVQAWFSNEDVDIEPGATISLKLSVQNLGDATDSYTIVPSGLTADWVNVGQGSLTLFAGSSDVVDVTIAPPKMPTTSAGPTSVGVRIIPTDSPDDTIVAETNLDVHGFDDRRIVPLQPVIRTRRRATYEFMVENHGNALASCRVRLIDPSGRVDGNFDPPAVGIAPGGSSLVRLKARAKRGIFRRSTRQLDFEVEAEQAGHEPAAGRLSLVQPPTIPASVIGKVAAVAAALGLIAAAWFHVVKPEINDAANDRVDERLTEFDAVVTDLEEATGEEVSVTTVVPEDDGPIDEEGTPLRFRLNVTPAQLDVADAAFTVPTEQLLDITDLRIENANSDTGSATLSVNGEELYVYQLSNIRGSFFEPGITQLRLDPGDNMTLSVRCNTVGDPALGTCSVAVNVRGRAIDVSDS